ncbi:MAG: hypothetical protein EA399_15725 [Desulfovibrionales bacterium]|nr:MAG: hypothetical protein EA399_15725 [Desulfovibrionales bacterium]
MRSLQKVPFPVKTCDVILLNTLERLDSGFRRNDEFQGFATFCSNIIKGALTQYLSYLGTDEANPFRSLLETDYDLKPSRRRGPGFHEIIELKPNFYGVGLNLNAAIDLISGYSASMRRWLEKKG